MILRIDFNSKITFYSMHSYQGMEPWCMCIIVEIFSTDSLELHIYFEIFQKWDKKRYSWLICGQFVPTSLWELRVPVEHQAIMSIYIPKLRPSF